MQSAQSGSSQAHVTLVPKPAFWDHPENLAGKWYKFFYEVKFEKDEQYLKGIEESEAYLQKEQKAYEMQRFLQRKDNLKKLQERRRAERILLQSSCQQRIDGPDVTQAAENMLREMSVDDLALAKVKRSGFRSGLQVPSKDSWNRLDLMSHKSAEIVLDSKSLHSDLQAVKSIEGKIRKELQQEIWTKKIKKDVHDMIKEEERNMKLINDMKRSCFEKLGNKLRQIDLKSTR